MVSDEVREAVEDACNSQVVRQGFEGFRKAIGVERALNLLYFIAQNLPSDMTMGELCDELCNGNNQGTFS